MSFKIRRVVSGLSPSEHVTESKLSSRPTDPSSGLDDGSPRLKRSRLKRLSVDIEDFIADGNSVLNGERSRFGGSSEKYRSSEKHGSSAYKKSSNVSSISVDQAGSPSKKGIQEGLNEGITFMGEKIINDKNEFRPLSRLQNGTRMDLGIKPQMENIEFDSSDHNSPQKLQKPPSLASQFSAPKSPFLADSVLSDGVPERRASETDLAFEQVKSVSYTPRRSSPLRKEILHHSSTTGDLVEEIRQSSALRSRSTQEILDQINSSMDRIRANAPSQGSSSNESSDSEEPVSGVDSPQNGLPANGIRFQGLSDFVPRDILKNFEEKRLPQPASSRPVAAKIATFKSRSLLEKESSQPRKRPLQTEPRESSAKKLKHSSKSPNYDAWSYEKWDKLKRLVESPIPKSVIIKNAIVMKELGCDSEQELQQRVEFLLRNKSQ